MKKLTKVFLETNNTIEAFQCGDSCGQCGCGDVTDCICDVGAAVKSGSLGQVTYLYSGSYRQSIYVGIKK